MGIVLSPVLAVSKEIDSGNMNTLTYLIILLISEDKRPEGVLYTAQAIIPTFHSYITIDLKEC